MSNCTTDTVILSEGAVFRLLVSNRHCDSRKPNYLLIFLLQVLDASLNFYPIWPEYIKNRTQFTVGWSYIVCWVGLGLTLVASILFALAAILSITLIGASAKVACSFIRRTFYLRQRSCSAGIVIVCL